MSWVLPRPAAFLLAVSLTVPVLIRAGEDPVAVFAGAAATRTGEAPGETSPVHVMRTGTESLEWVLPDGLPAGLYRVEMTVRTGTTDTNGANIAHLYRVAVYDPQGEQRDGAAFTLKNGTTPVRTSEQWPHFTGDVESTSPVSISATGRLAVRAPGTAWAEVVEVRLLPPREEDLLHVAPVWSLPHGLVPRGQDAGVALRLTSFRPTPVPVSGRVVVTDPYGVEGAPVPVDATVPPRGETTVRVPFIASLNGFHVVRAELSCRGIDYVAELPLTVVSVPAPTELPASSPFGLHSAGLDELFASGFKWVRLWDTGDTWNSHERESKGAFDFSSTERKVDRFIAQGFEVLAVLAYTPAWASTRPDAPHYTGAGAPYPPRDIADWRDYCREYMNRFRGRIRYFEVWNEPNTGAEDGFFRGTADEYVALLRAARDTAREVDPDIRILGGSGTGDFLSWTEEILKRGAGEHMDILSFHAYTTPRSPEDANLDGRLDRMREIMGTYGAADLPLWNTEVGYWQDPRVGVRPAGEEDVLAKAPPEFYPNRQPGWPYRPITEDEAAAFTVRHYYLNLAHGVERLFWYSAATDGMPMLCRDGSPRLLCIAVANAAEQLLGMRYRERRDFGIAKLHAHLWEGTDTAVIVWYAGEGTRRLRFPGAARVRATDIWGNPVVLPVEEGGVVVEAGRDPVVLRFDGGLPEAPVLASREILLPVTDSRVAAEVNPEHPVREHTSPLYHGDRRVYGLPDPGDAMAWTIRAIPPARYVPELELQAGFEGDPYGRLGDYRLTVIRGDDVEEVRLVPVDEPERRPRPVGTAEGGNRAYGWARAEAPVALADGTEVRVSLTGGGYGFVGALLVRDDRGERAVHELARPGGVPVADGDLAEAAGLPAFALQRRDRVVIGVADPFASTSAADAWQGPEDLSGTIRPGVAGDTLYLAVEVTDGGGLRRSANGAYDGDCIEVFLDVRPADRLGRPSVEAGVYHVMLRAPEPGSPAEAEWRMPPGTKVAAIRTQAGWSAEFVIPLPPGIRGRRIGLDVALDDADDGGRKAQMVLFGTAANYEDPSGYGRFLVP